MILKSDEAMAQLKKLVGEDTSEDTISFIENISDTLTSLESKVNNNSDMVPKSELDRVNEEWARKYRDRFFEGTTPPPEPQPNENENNNENNNEPLTFENLFKEM